MKVIIWTLSYWIFYVYIKLHLNEAFFQSQLIKMLDDSWVIVGDIVDTMENQDENLVGGDCRERGEEWSGQRWCKFTSGEKMAHEIVSESNFKPNVWKGEMWRKYC